VQELSCYDENATIFIAFILSISQKPKKNAELPVDCEVGFILEPEPCRYLAKAW
jgi:hypothetical protein